MGGHAVGELASKIAADTIPHTYHKLHDMPAPEALRSAVLTGNATINARGELNRDFTRMGTTCTTLVLGPQGALIAHVGDSRAYRVRGDRIEQLTFDHSLQWELLRQGRMSPDEIMRREPRNVITRSLGPSPTVEVDLEGPYPTRPDDVYILCSDGLTSLVRDDEIGIAVRELPPTEACRLLVDLANLRGGPDNITVIVVRVGAVPPDLPLEELPAVESTRETLLGWFQPLLLLFAGIAFIAGHLLTTTERPLAGFLVQALGIVAIGGLALSGLRSRRLATERALLPETTPGTPYRTASARINSAFVSELANVENNLQRSAIEEGWSIEWSQHGQYFQSGKGALAEARLTDALQNFAKAIHILMGGIHLIRKQRDQLARWGQRPPTRDESEPNGK
jgi:protein phosphatase